MIFYLCTRDSLTFYLDLLWDFAFIYAFGFLPSICVSCCPSFPISRAASWPPPTCRVQHVSLGQSLLSREGWAPLDPGHTDRSPPLVSGHPIQTLYLYPSPGHKNKGPSAAWASYFLLHLPVWFLKLQWFCLWKPGISKCCPCFLTPWT